MEMEKVPQAGYDIIGLPIRGIQRRLSPANLKVPFLLLKSLMMSRKTIRDFRPDAAIGVGGYASAALLYMASLMKVRTLIQEQNSYPGLTNKFLGRRVDVVCVAFPNMEQFFPREKVRLLGNPIRQDILKCESKSDESLAHFGLNRDKKTILAVGGSLGARTINRCMLRLMDLMEELNIQLIWQCGRSQAGELQEEVKSRGNENVKLQAFIKRMDLAYAAADLVISRSGALAVSEIMTLKKASVLIPSPNVAEDHQTKNAKALTDQGAAILLEDANAEERIMDLVRDLMTSEQKMEELKSRLDGVFSNANAAGDIAAEVEKLTGHAH